MGIYENICPCGCVLQTTSYNDWDVPVPVKFCKFHSDKNPPPCIAYAKMRKRTSVINYTGPSDPYAPPPAQEERNFLKNQHQFPGFFHKSQSTNQNDNY